MNPEFTRIIEQYLSGELSLEDKIKFEEELSKNEDLQKELQLQQRIHEAAERFALRQEVSKVAKNYHFSNKLKWGGLGLGILTVLVSTALLIKSTSSKRDDFNLEEVKQLTDKLQESGPIDQLKSTFFAWNANDTAFLSAEGVLVSIPDNAFLLNGKPYKEPAVIQWQEALDGASIVKAGLSTVSDGKLLETQGMFSFSAKTPEGKQLTINPKVGIYVQVPVDEYKEGMQLFDGEKDANGNINWVKPRPLEKIPVPVSMSQLDFYPPEYEAKLNELKARKGKKYRDSLYLSFERFEEELKIGNRTDLPEIEGDLPLYVLPKRRLTEKENLLIYGRNVPINRNMEFSEAFILKHRNQDVSDDLKQFPADFFVNDKHGRYYLYQRAELKQVLKDYLQSNAFELANWDMRKQTDNPTNKETSANFEFIPPAAVLSFWTPKFDNTLLSTHEFEARMKEIHGTCDKSILEIYLKNITKPLCELDQMVVDKGYPQFSAFVNERVGALNPTSPHLEGLMAFYDKNVEDYQQHEKSLRNRERKKRAKWDKEVKTEREKEIARTVERNENSFSEEYKLNFKNVKKQLGRVVGAKIYGVNPISNIDRFVEISTITRETKEIYDPLTGKKASIQYNDFSFEVPDFKKYDKLFAYVFPDELNSYHRIEGKNGEFSFPLNEAMKYDLVIVGISAKGYSYVQRLAVKSGKLGALNLEAVTEEKLDASIRQLNAKRGIKSFDVKDEIRWLKKEQKNYVEQKRRSDDQEFRIKVRPAVFPCSVPVESSVSKNQTIEIPENFDK
jgi:hypothetical protein